MDPEKHREARRTEKSQKEKYIELDQTVHGKKL